MKIWEVYPRLTEIVQGDHIVFGMMSTGHPFDHTLRTGQIATIIAEDEYVARIGGAAGLCHNADRLLQHQLNAGKEVGSESHI